MVKAGYNETGASSSATLSHRDISFIPLPPTLYLCVGQTVKIRSGPKGHTCFCCVVITVSLSPSLSLSVSSQDAPVEDSSIEVVEPERGSVN